MVNGNIELVKKYYENEQYERVIDFFTSYENVDDSIWYLICTLFECGEWSLFTELYNSVNIERIGFDDSSRIDTYFALINFYDDNFEVAFKLLQKVSDMGMEYSFEAKKWLTLLDFRGAYTCLLDGILNIHFFDGISDKNKIAFLQDYSIALKTIKEYFDFGKIGMINVYVFATRKDSIGNSLSYSNTKLKTAFVYVNDECGHEITHIITENLYNIHLHFLREGIAECFDQMKKKYAFSPMVEDIQSIEDISENSEKYDIMDIHFVGGLFIANAMKSIKGNSDKIRRLLEAKNYAEIKTSLGPNFLLVEKNTLTDIKKITETKKTMQKYGENVYDSQYRISIMQE